MGRAAPSGYPAFAKATAWQAVISYWSFKTSELSTEFVHQAVAQLDDPAPSREATACQGRSDVRGRRLEVRQTLNSQRSSMEHRARHSLPAVAGRVRPNGGQGAR